MNRKKFLLSLSATGLSVLKTGSILTSMNDMKEIYFEDDGKMPNSKFPLVLYKNAFGERDRSGAAWLEKRFALNNWTNSWRNGIYSFHHYHSTSHEVLGIYSGQAMVHLGGESGEKLNLEAGDIIIIPAGVGHKNLDSENLGVVGAYPNGRSWDLNRGRKSERPRADKNIAALPIPLSDPILGKGDGIVKIWRGI